VTTALQRDVQISAQLPCWIHEFYQLQWYLRMLNRKKYGYVQAINTLERIDDINDRSPFMGRTNRRLTRSEQSPCNPLPPALGILPIEYQRPGPGPSPGIRISHTHKSYRSHLESQVGSRAASCCLGKSNVNAVLRIGEMAKCPVSGPSSRQDLSRCIFRLSDNPSELGQFK